MKITNGFVVGAILCAAPFALAVRADIKHKNDKHHGYGDDDDDYDFERQSHSEDLDDPDLKYEPPPEHKIEKKDLLELIGSQPATLGPLLDGVRLGGSADSYEPDTTRERIEQFQSDHDYNLHVDYDADIVQLNGVTLRVDGDESELRDALISAWGTPKRLDEETLIWIGAGQRAVYKTSYNGFELTFEPFQSLDAFVAPADKTKLGVEPIALVGSTVDKLRDVVGAKIQSQDYGDGVMYYAPGLPDGIGKTEVTVNTDPDGTGKILSISIEASSADLDAVKAAIDAKWGPAKTDDYGDVSWKVKGVTYTWDTYDRGFTIRASK
jgi:hypothetical protein